MTKLMVIADGEKQLFSIPRGIELAHQLGHSVEVVAFTWAPLKGLGSSDKARADIKQRLLNAREQQIEDLVARYRRKSQKVKIKVSGPARSPTGCSNALRPALMPGW